MRILIKENGGHTIRLRIPSRLVLNSLTAGIAPRYLQEQGIRISKAQALAFIREINRFRKRHRDWKLVEVLAADGDRVEIRL